LQADNIVGEPALQPALRLSFSSTRPAFPGQNAGKSPASLKPPPLRPLTKLDDYERISARQRIDEIAFCVSLHVRTVKMVNSPRAAAAWRRC